MTPLRNQLEAARREYQSIRYDGDLPRENLSPAARWRGMFLMGAFGAGAIAAAAMFATLVARPLLTPAASHPQTSVPMVRMIKLPSKLDIDIPSMPRMPSIPGMPSHLSLREMAPSLVPPEGLHLPSLDEIHMPTMFESREHA